MATKKEGELNRKSMVDVFDHQRQTMSTVPYGSYLDNLKNETMSQKGSGKRIMRYTLGKAVKLAPKTTGAEEA